MLISCFLMIIISNSLTFALVSRESLVPFRNREMDYCRLNLNVSNSFCSYGSDHDRLHWDSEHV